MNETLSRPLLNAARAWRLPTGRAGLWRIRRVRLSGMTTLLLDSSRLGPYTVLTVLERTTLATLHDVFGECVMEDSEVELARHLPAMLGAQGRVLVTGLGLGCVVRGMLATGRVTHVDVVECDPAILTLVGPSFAREPRVTLHQGDARTIAWPDSARWDFAWHDVWDEHEPLDLVHAKLIAQYADRVTTQGAWGFNRIAKNAWSSRLAGASRRRRALSTVR
jgi:spermidine synthase